MRIIIENYRGWEIYFDTNKEEFYTVSNEYDRDISKKSYSSAKKYIDDYLKANVSFTPVKVQRMPNKYSGEPVITLTGIRKDERFMYETSSGEKKQLSQYDEGLYFLVDPENEKIFSQMRDVENKIEVLEKELDAIAATVKKVGIDEIRKKYVS